MSVKLFSLISSGICLHDSEYHLIKARIISHPLRETLSQMHYQFSIS